MSFIVFNDIFNKAYLTLNAFNSIRSNIEHSQPISTIIYGIWLLMMGISQIGIAVFLMIVTYKLVIRSEKFIDCMMNFTALYIINEFDDIVGNYFGLNFISYDSFCKFRRSEDDIQYIQTFIWFVITTCWAGSIVL
jgi:uncharacterized membrane protein